MDALERDYNTVLLARHEPPCLSLYQPTHRFASRKAAGSDPFSQSRKRAGAISAAEIYGPGVRAHPTPVPQLGRK
jgi:hypothetical protein